MLFPIYLLFLSPVFILLILFFYSLFFTPHTQTDNLIVSSVFTLFILFVLIVVKLISG